MDYPFQFNRIQYIVKVCFAVTIDKAQGQSLKIIEVDLRRHPRPAVCGLFLDELRWQLVILQPEILNTTMRANMNIS